MSVIELATEQLRLGVLPFGATVTSLRTPDAHGAWADVALGLEPDDYRGRHPFLGATVGRFANRIAGAELEIDGVRHRLSANEGGNTLHGGTDGFGRREWEVVHSDDRSVTLRLISPDGDMGFPGRLDVTTTYSVDGPTVTQATIATTSAPTVVNLTNHTYFNLHGTPERAIDDHVLRLPAGCYLPVGPDRIPLPGPPTRVAGTAFDFRTPRAIGAAAYDHTFVIDGVIELVGGGRRLRVATTDPGVQLYTGDHLAADRVLHDRDGRPLRARSGMCLETQHLPDAPHRPDYPSTLLRPGDTYRTVTSWEVTPYASRLGV